MMTPLQAETNLKRYGKMLMGKVPQQTTELLKRLCTDYRPTDSKCDTQFYHSLWSLIVVGIGSD